MQSTHAILVPKAVQKWLRLRTIPALPVSLITRMCEAKELEKEYLHTVVWPDGLPNLLGLKIVFFSSTGTLTAINASFEVVTELAPFFYLLETYATSSIHARIAGCLEEIYAVKFSDLLLEYVVTPA